MKFFFFFLVLLGLHLWHMEVPRLGDELELWLMPLPQPQQQQRQIQAPSTAQPVAMLDPYPPERGQGSNPSPRGY